MAQDPYTSYLQYQHYPTMSGQEISSNFNDPVIAGNMNSYFQTNYPGTQPWKPEPPPPQPPLLSAQQRPNMAAPIPQVANISNTQQQPVPSMPATQPEIANPVPVQQPNALLPRKPIVQEEKASNADIAVATGEGALSGAATGAVIAGPWGAAAGAVVGGAYSYAKARKLF